VHLRYKHSPLDAAGAKRLYEDFKGKILTKLQTFVSQSDGNKELDGEDETMLAALILLITAAVRVFEAGPALIPDTVIYCDLVGCLR
jgi:hypothetical protein